MRLRFTRALKHRPYSAVNKRVPVATTSPFPSPANTLQARATKVTNIRSKEGDARMLEKSKIQFE
jgi:hypothetical protein